MALPTLEILCFDPHWQLQKDPLKLVVGMLPYPLCTADVCITVMMEGRIWIFKIDERCQGIYVVRSVTTARSHRRIELLETVGVERVSNDSHRKILPSTIFVSPLQPFVHAFRQDSGPKKISDKC